MENKKNKIPKTQITVNITTDDYKNVIKICKKNYLPRAVVFRDLIKRGLEDYNKTA